MPMCTVSHACVPHISHPCALSLAFACPISCIHAVSHARVPCLSHLRALSLAFTCPVSRICMPCLSHLHSHAPSLVFALSHAHGMPRCAACPARVVVAVRPSGFSENLKSTARVVVAVLCFEDLARFSKVLLSPTTKYLVICNLLYGTLGIYPVALICVTSRHLFSCRFHISKLQILFQWSTVCTPKVTAHSSISQCHRQAQYFTVPEQFHTLSILLSNLLSLALHVVLVLSISNQTFASSTFLYFFIHFH